MDTMGVGDGLGSETVETVIIGAGQAGLAAGYHLARRGRPFVVLHPDARVGDGWRRHWDSLRLYSAARYDGLPGMAFPASRHAFPTKEQMADYLEAYAERFDLPVRAGIRVDAIDRVGDRYVLTAGVRRIEAENVVVASGTWGEPHVPDFAGELDPGIVQLHSSGYRNPAQLREGGVLVVGASHSGADIAFEVAAGHPTVLSGPIRGEIPFRIEGRPARVVMRVMWFAATRVLTVGTPIGRKMRPEVRSHGGPLIRIRSADLRSAGVEHVASRTVGSQDGLPVLDDGRVLDVANVIWSTGFRPDYSWIHLPILGADGYPDQVGGAVESQPGLYFVGLPFLHSFSSMLVGGAGRDAQRVVDHLDAHAPGRRQAAGASGRSST